VRRPRPDLVRPVEDRARLVDDQLRRAFGRYDAALGPRLRAILEVEPWSLWATLYVDAGGGGPWHWGARGRVGLEVGALLPGPGAFLVASGDCPEAAAGDSGQGELWGIAHALAAAIRAWPWLTGVGVRCDNAEAVRHVAGVGRVRPALEGALAAIGDARRAGVQVRAEHVRGHGRAETGQQRAWNASADRLARAARAARRGNA
jgi:hypothetical protein